MQRRDPAKPFHLADRKVAHPDGADLPLREQCVHCVSGFFDRNQRVGPMNLIDIDVIGLKPAQGIFDLPYDAGAAGIAGYSSTLPLKPGLGGYNHIRAQLAFGDGLANDLLGATESIDRGGVNNVDAMLECGPDGSDRFPLVGTAPHPAADRPSTDSDGRHLERRTVNLAAFHIHFESFCLMSHDSFLPLSSAT